MREKGTVLCGGRRSGADVRQFADMAYVPGMIRSLYEPGEDAICDRQVGEAHARGGITARGVACGLLRLWHVSGVRVSGARKTCVYSARVVNC